MMEDIDTSFFVIVNIIFSDQAFTILQTNDTRALTTVHLVVLYDGIGMRTNIDSYRRKSKEYFVDNSSFDKGL